MASDIDTATAETAAPSPRGRRRAGARAEDASSAPSSRRRAGSRGRAPRGAPRRRRRAARPRRIAADAPHPRGQRAAAGAAGARLSLSRQVRGEPDRASRSSRCDAGPDLRRARSARAPCSTRPIDGEMLLPELARADDAPAGRADPHPRPAVRPRRQADRGQPRAARPGRPGRRSTELPPPGEQGLRCRASPTRLYDWIVGAVCRSGRDCPLYRGGRHRGRRLSARSLRALQGESGSAVRSDPQTRRAGDQRRGAGAALQAGARRGHAVDRQRRYRATSCARCGSNCCASSRSRCWSRCCCRSISPARSRGRSGGSRRRRSGRAAAARRIEIPDFTGRGDEIGELSGRAARDDRRAVAADERDRELRRRCRARDQEPAVLAAQRGRDRRRASTTRQSSAG